LDRVAPDGLPVPPQRLIVRAGATPGRDPVEQYLALGAAGKRMLELMVASVAGENWFDGRRILDFGCGAGQTLRQFAVDGTAAELWGCDVDADSVAWLERNLSPPLNLFAVGDGVWLPKPDEYFDLVYAFSVFTHLVADWAAWALELHRVLGPDGLLVVSFLGEGMIELEGGGGWDPDRIGMNVLRAGQDWDGGGPTVFHSAWWIAAHWGRAFELLAIHQDRDASGDVVPGSHALAVMRKRPVSLTAAELERPEDGEPREVAALRHNIEQLHTEDRRLRDHLEAAIARGNAEHELRIAAEAKVAAMSRSRSWRLTKPLRQLSRFF
jgi:SAM-dependent methyltransferase